MTCDRFDPITASVAPCCAVCSHHGACEKESAATDVASIHDGKAEQIDTPVSASSIHE